MVRTLRVRTHRGPRPSDCLASQSVNYSRVTPFGTAARAARRPRGVGALSSAELLAILLGSGGAGRSALQVGQSVLAEAGGALRWIARQPVAALTAVPGVGMARAVTIHASLELGRRMAAEGRQDGTPVRSPRDVVAYFAPRMEDLPVEEFHVAVLDAQHRLERDITVTRGILNSSLVHPREVFREAIAERAAAVILVHNHPSGDPTPSADDRIGDRAARRGRTIARHSGARPRDHRTGTVHELRGGGTVVTATAAAVRELIPGWREDELPLHDKLDRELLVRAYRFSEAAHRGQVRNSGDPYITHSRRGREDSRRSPARLDRPSPAGCSTTSSRTRRSRSPTSRREFGKEIAAIVDGLTKIAKLPTGGSTQERQVESYRKLLLSIAKDARVIIVKLADRLHNMRTLDWLPAGEAAAHRAGDARPLRAARASLRYGEDAVGARGSRVQASRTGGVQGAREAGRAEARRARSADRGSWREPLDARAGAARASRTSTSPAGRSTSGRSTRR